MSDDKPLGDSIFGRDTHDIHDTQNTPDSPDAHGTPNTGAAHGGASRPEAAPAGDPSARAPHAQSARAAAAPAGPGEGDRGDGATSAPPAGRQKKPLGRRLVVYVLAVAVVLGGGAVAWAGLSPIYQHFTAAKDYPGPGSGSVSVTVASGDTGRDIGNALQKAGVVLTADAFTSAIADNPGDDVQPGTYSLKKEMSAAEALSAMRQGARDVVKVTLREGLWKSEVFAALSKATKRPLADYQAAEKQIKANPGLVGLPVSAKGNLEGYLFPATYSFDPGTSAVEQLRQMVKNSVAQLTALGVTPQNMENIVTIASIVEAEARLDADRPKVSRVIANRLKINMPLQLDSTVSYGVQKRAITTSDKERAAKNGYNTYVNPGLPAGPIDNPGAASITAAQKPADGPWLYFVTVDPDTGKTLFATTLAEHNANVAVFQKWCQGHPGKC